LINTNKSYKEQELEIAWEKIRSPEKSGLIDISWFKKRGRKGSDWIWARKILTAEKDETRQITFGYSDYISVFLNGELLFVGNSAYQSRDPGFSGIIGLFDNLLLPLKKGDNELLFLIGETFGGWGFMCRDADARYQHQSISESWESPLGLRYPESAVYDSKRDILYVSNFYNGMKEFISKVKTSGEIEQLEWLSGLILPTGLAIYDDMLYAVERRNLVEIDLESGKIKNRYPIPNPTFPNDVAVDSSGNIYISDNDGSKIYRFFDQQFEVWLDGGEIKSPNSLHIKEDKLIVGNTGDYSLKAVDLKSKEIETIAILADGAVIDGIDNDENGNYLVSDFNGKLYLITPYGEKTLLLDVSAEGNLLADFGYIKDKNLLVIPGLYTSRLKAFEYSL
jgi:sugar lactone lactonase YvrE